MPETTPAEARGELRATAAAAEKVATRHWASSLANIHEAADDAGRPLHRVAELALGLSLYGGMGSINDELGSPEIYELWGAASNALIVGFNNIHD